MKINSKHAITYVHAHHTMSIDSGDTYLLALQVIGVIVNASLLDKECLIFCGKSLKVYFVIRDMDNSERLLKMGDTIPYTATSANSSQHTSIFICSNLLIMTQAVQVQCVFYFIQVCSIYLRLCDMLVWLVYVGEIVGNVVKVCKFGKSFEKSGNRFD